MREHVLERREAPADVVEHPVQQQPDAPFAAPRGQVAEVLFRAEPRVDTEVVHGVVAVRLAGEDRAEGQPVGAQIDQVVQPRLDPAEPVRGWRRLRGGFRAGEADRVHVPPDRVRRPVRHVPQPPR